MESRVRFIIPQSTVYLQLWAGRNEEDEKGWKSGNENAGFSGIALTRCGNATASWRPLRVFFSDLIILYEFGALGSVHKHVAFFGDLHWGVCSINGDGV